MSLPAIYLHEDTFTIFAMALLLIILAQFWYDVFLRGYEDFIGGKPRFWHLILIASILTIIFFIGLKYVAKISITEVI